MVYVYISLITLGIFFAEYSLAPHLLPFIAVPFLFLPFLSIISLKDRTIFPIILAGAMGLLTDAVAGNVIPIFSISYIAVSIISKAFLSRFISYGEFRANLINASLGLIIIYGLEIALRTGTITGIAWWGTIVVNFLLTFTVLLAYTVFCRKFFNWVEKETEERFR